MARSLPRWQSSDSRATKMSSDRDGGGGLFANGLSAGTSRSSGWSTCRTAPSAPRSIRTNLYLHSSDRASRSASATAASLCFARTFPGASARKPTLACSVKRLRRLVKPMAHMVWLFYCGASMASGLLPHTWEATPTAREGSRTRRVLQGESSTRHAGLSRISGREWAALSCSAPLFGSHEISSVSLH